MGIFSAKLSLLFYNNLWFMDFKLISKSDISPLLVKYDEEILKTVGQYDNAEKPLEKYLSKVVFQMFFRFSTRFNQLFRKRY